jgi:uncharacterized membrane protein YqjE
VSGRPTEDDWYRNSGAPSATGRPTSGVSGNGAAEGKSAGQLMKEISEDFSTLFRKEVELIKQELGQSISTKVKGAVIIVLAGSLAFFALIFMLLAIRDGFDNILWTWVADLATAGVLLVIGLIAVLVAKRKLTAPISTELTKKTIKEDVEWAKTLGKQ